MPSFLTANRVAAIATWLAALAALITAVAGTFPQAWQNGAVAAAALLTKAVVTLKFMDGSQKFDALQARPGAAMLAGPDQVTALLERRAGELDAIQNEPGVPESLVEVGLSPDDLAVTPAAKPRRASRPAAAPAAKPDTPAPVKGAGS